MPNPVLDQDRVAFLKSRTKTGSVSVPAWPRPDKELPKVVVQVDWVRFSTMNHRTTVEQLREKHRTGNPHLFDADPLGHEAQQSQYRILAAQEGFEPLKEDLKERGQQEPAIITAEGVLINGNRRTAALRALYQDDNHLKSQYVHCLVLPEDANENELVDLEAELQIARDFRESYSWINEAFLIEELYNREGRDLKRVAARMHRSVSHVQSTYEKLLQVHQIVDMSNGARLHVDFTDNESAFTELTRHIKGKPPAEANSVRSVYHLGTLANVQYRKLRNLQRPDASQQVWQEISKDDALKPLLQVVAEETDGSESDDPLDDVLGSPPDAIPTDALLSFLAQRRPEESIALADGSKVLVRDALGSVQSAISVVADDLGEDHKDQTAAQVPLKQVERALANLGKALAALPKARAYPSWDEADFAAKLDSADALLRQLRDDS
ncbi:MULTISPECIES: ParB N-terminal domain-containing protein [Actinosynnema]|uniref:ParB N-terminal domain-containing protein n=1 Tax=Actinosynnema TaxID=40566 RepID=UPI0020A60531|nr:ParB N-terminal domain-containing protein [Actinosynnema pretiosum]MCP2096765.1 Chromosome segregation protein Spo0J, contains ParB-like nuclease domain [Actinosynnema pretiosum]